MDSLPSGNRESSPPSSHPSSPGQRFGLWICTQGGKQRLFTTLHCIGTGWFWEGRKGTDPRAKEVTAVRAVDPEEAEDAHRRPLRSAALQPPVHAAPAARCGFPEEGQSGGSAQDLQNSVPPEETCPPPPWGGPRGPLPSALPTQETPATRSRQRAASEQGDAEPADPGVAGQPTDAQADWSSSCSPSWRASEVAGRGLRLPDRLLAPGDRGHRTGQGGALALRPAHARAPCLISKNSPSAPEDRGKPLEEPAGLARPGPASRHLSRSSGSARRPRAPPTPFLPGFTGAADAGSPRGTARSAAPRIPTSSVRRARGQASPYPGIPHKPAESTQRAAREARCSSTPGGWPSGSADKSAGRAAATRPASELHELALHTAESPRRGPAQPGTEGV
ncbi:uncharacterized protein LOC144336597 [Macaca mulatta]